MSQKKDKDFVTEFLQIIFNLHDVWLLSLIADNYPPDTNFKYPCRVMQELFLSSMYYLDMEVTMSSTFFDANNGTNYTSAQTTFYVTGGGIAFQLGAGSRESEQAFIGIDRVGSDNLGSFEAGGFLSDLVTGGDYTLLRDPETANKILSKAMDDVAAIRAKLGAFVNNTLETNVNSLNVAIENIQASESRIRDTDFATETAEFTRLQILVQAGTAVVAQANLLPQTVLSLLA